MSIIVNFLRILKNATKIDTNFSVFQHLNEITLIKIENRANRVAVVISSDWRIL